MHIQSWQCIFIPGGTVIEPLFQSMGISHVSRDIATVAVGVTFLQLEPAPTQ